MGDSEETERRQAMAERLARLEERSVNNQEQLARIERLLGQQGAAMEKMMGQFTQKIDDLEDSIETKVDSLDKKIDPLQGQINYWRGALWIIGGLTVIALGILTKILFGV